MYRRGGGILVASSGLMSQLRGAGMLARATAAGRDAKVTKKEAAARQQRTQAFEEAVRKLKRQPVVLERTPEEMEEARAMALEFSQKSLAQDRAKWYFLKKFVESKLYALNELPPDLREQAMMIDSRPFPEQMVQPGLTPALEPEWNDLPMPNDRNPSLHPPQAEIEKLIKKARAAKMRAEERKIREVKKKKN